MKLKLLYRFHFSNSQSSYKHSMHFNVAQRWILVAFKCNVYLQCIHNLSLLISIDSFKFRFQKSFDGVRARKTEKKRNSLRSSRNCTIIRAVRMASRRNWTVVVFLGDYHCRNNRVAEKRGNSREGCDPAIHGRTNSTTILHVVYIARLSP